MPILSGESDGLSGLYQRFIMPYMTSFIPLTSIMVEEFVEVDLGCGDGCIAGAALIEPACTRMLASLYISAVETDRWDSGLVASEDLTMVLTKAPRGGVRLMPPLISGWAFPRVS